MAELTVEQLLQARYYIELSWIEPWQGMDDKFEDKDITVEMRANVHDCINLARQKYARLFNLVKKPIPHEITLLNEFVMIYWVEVVPLTTKKYRECHVT